MMRRPLANKRPVGPVLEFSQNGGIEDGDVLFIKDTDEFLKAVRNTIEVTENITVVRETQESVDIRIDAIDKQSLIRATE